MNLDCRLAQQVHLLGQDRDVPLQIHQLLTEHAHGGAVKVLAAAAGRIMVLEPFRVVRVLQLVQYVLAWRSGLHRRLARQARLQAVEDLLGAGAPQAVHGARVVTEPPRVAVLGLGGVGIRPAPLQPVPGIVTSVQYLRVQQGAPLRRNFPPGQPLLPEALHRPRHHLEAAGEGDLHLCSSQLQAGIREHQHDVGQVGDVQLQHVQIRQRAHPMFVAQVLVRDQHVLTPDVTAKQDAASR
mmetsp:Transcript_81638/g.212971  ORF Transcript_81638/g.212971 Transcript_81638/m.212971 type:complete len:240 (+) Transcript_81638:358-1077(+)